MSTIVFLGDSITQGIREGVIAADIFSYKIGNAFNFSTVINKGAPNSLANTALNRIQSDVINYNPKYCVIMLGTNDVLNKISVLDYKTSVSDIVKKLKLQNIAPMIFSPPLGRSTEQINSFPDYLIALEEIGFEEKIPVIDIYRRFCHASLYLSKEDFSELYTDWVHLSPKGHQLITDVILEEAYSNLFNS